MQKIFLFALTFFSSIHALATHLRGGQITIRPIDCVSNIYEIRLTIYTNTRSPVHVDNGTLNFGDGKSIVIPEQNSIVIDTDNAVGQVVFITNHLYSSGGYTVSYYEENRDTNILNINPAGGPFYIESYFTANPGLCEHVISFKIPPTDRACSGTAFTHNPGVVVNEGDSVSYELITPLQRSNSPVEGYQSPNSSKFYSNNYQTSNEAANGAPTIQIDEDGTLTWDAPGITGEYDIAMKVFQWTNIDGAWVNTTWVIRDMQIIVQDCGVARPYLNIPASICVQPGELKQIFRGYSKVFSPLKIDVTSLDNFISSAPKFINGGIFQSTAPPYDTANLKMIWDITCDLVRPKPYKFIFKISSYTQGGIRVSSFQTWSVTVVGSPPKYKSLTLNLATKKLNIQWDNYACSNAKTIQIWRRVDRGPSQIDACQTGIPKSWGFIKIGETTDNNFTDSKLSPGATYCYRLLAIYTNPYKAVSLSSKDTCIGPIVADAPVITNVSVTNTDKSNGSILTKWTSPFQINKTLFPSPYLYDIFRTTDGNNFKLITRKFSDTTFVDSGLDVVDSLYGYKIVVYSPNSISRDNPIDTSALAFYPRLSFQPLTDTIKLSWGAEIPWSNQSVRFPWHFIYRKDFGMARYTLIDSVNTTINEDFEYKDYVGKKSFPIQNNRIYQYKIETQGSYGNSHIHEPLQNFSNEVIGQTIDKSPPCAPTLELSSTDCETLLNSPCTTNTFINQLSWKYSSDCGNDVAYYKVIFSETQDSDSTFLTSTSDLIYLDQKKNSKAGCYRVLAVDRSGNVGPISNSICVENCTYVFIPNVISVNNDGLNETFPSLSDVSETREPYKCPRFVKEFSLQIYDRWGRQVYSVNNLETGHPDFEWKGLDENGHELPTGLYYYSANILFYALNPELQNKKVKGWVSLVR